MAHRQPAAPEGEGDNYLASLSDLMVGLLFIFIIILMAFALNYRVAQQSTTQVVEQLTNAEHLRRALLETLERSLKAQGVNVQIDLENGIMRLPEAMLFDSGSADFRPGGLESLDKVARNLSELLPCKVHDPAQLQLCNARGESRLDAIFIEGHTDVIPIRNREFADNWELSAARSKRTWQTLMARAPLLGTLQNRRKQLLFSISAYGETRPVADNATEDGRQKNRRIDLRFIMDTPDLSIAEK